MFKEVGLLDKPLPQGVTSTQGQNNSSRAFHFTTQAQNLVANQSAFNNTDTLIHNSQDFWVSAWVKLDANDYSDNTILSISSGDGNHLYFKLKISWVKLKWIVNTLAPGMWAGGGGGRGHSHMKVRAGMLVVSLGCTLLILASLRVLGSECHYICPFWYRFGLFIKKFTKTTVTSRKRKSR